MAIKYVDNEIEKYKEIKLLLKSWKNEVSGSKIERGRNSGCLGKDLLREDGFFSNYYKQKYKVLFIGREDVRGIDAKTREKGSMVEYWLEIFEKIRIGNSYGFLGSLLRLLHGIEKAGVLKYKDLPKTDDIAKRIGRDGGLSFSIMDFSKYVNQDSNDYRCDKSLVRQFLEHSHLDKNSFFKMKF
jgi:hypothetical protein